MIKSNYTVSCLFEGKLQCVPRADAIFIRYENEPDDPWAIDQITVKVRFMTGHYDMYENVWFFEHTLPLPCMSYLSKKRLYQIGPRNGLFIEHKYKYFPFEETWIRDWL
ncbi:unnamed protein product [Strongylus vulgaris]|uniref:Uncharacterized protein n=1 Tax=Strongylus vulgaris TaxID=40348 RepID=A0A3P7IC33_STRVU|nr:unnamed protein product [Strongylus vulgaris]